ncbi:TPA: hypothetical protein G8O64_001880 [Salmonella enterica]|uniref:Uncharacterized protein n=1 Tax=Salmonella enterica TaxID=28901 RepID=A0A759GUQ9_SALER|nr:hypothetical protein [Salmonella enterica]HAG5356305.1 hypothetical protein [Salmonella enterica]
MFTGSPLPLKAEGSVFWAQPERAHSKASAIKRFIKNFLNEFLI